MSTSRLEQVPLRTHSDHPEQNLKIPPTLFFTGRKLRPAGIGIEAPGGHLSKDDKYDHIDGSDYYNGFNRKVKNTTTNSTGGLCEDDDSDDANILSQYIVENIFQMWWDICICW